MSEQAEEKKKTDQKNNSKKQVLGKQRNQLKRICGREKGVARIQKANLLSNEFMTVALQDIPACQHVLRVITGISDLVVKEVRTQYRISKLYSHDAILDILAEDKEGRLYNIEIQRSGTLDHARRVRFYGAMVDSEFLQKGKEYAKMPEVRIIYISEKDIWKKKQTVYKVKKVFENTNDLYEDGIEITYINAEINDGSKIAKLMEYFKKADPKDMSQGDLSKRIHFLKCEEGGHSIMREILDDILWEEKREGRREGRREGKREQARSTARNLAKMGLTIDQIAQAVGMNTGLVKKWVKM